jgi:hypothetical protein
MTQVPMNPWITNSFLDTCAFDPKYDPETSAAIEIFRLHSEEGLPLVLAHTVAKEIEHPNTPRWVKQEARNQIFSVPVPLTPPEQAKKSRIHTVLTGNGKPRKILR